MYNPQYGCKNTGMTQIGGGSFEAKQSSNKVTNGVNPFLKLIGWLQNWWLASKLMATPEIGHH